MNTSPRDADSGSYRIRVHGRLAPRWATRFDGMTLTPQDDGTTLITGRVLDQAALHGLLQHVRDSGLQLISVTQPDLDAPGHDQHDPTKPREALSTERRRQP